MNGFDILNHDAFRMAVIILAVFLIFWVFKKIVRFLLILLIVGFLIWHFWLS